MGSSEPSGGGNGGGSTPKPKPKRKIVETTPKVTRFTGRPDDAADTSRADPFDRPAPKPARSFTVTGPSASSGASRSAPANIAEERSAIRAPGQRSAAAVAQDRRVRPKEPGGVDDRAPVMSKPQRAYESIQELRGRREKAMPGMLGAMSRISLDSQIKKLQEGGTPVMSGTMTVGVVSQGGSYTGRPEFADLARSGYRTAGAEIRAPIGARRSQPSGDGDSQVTAPATAPSESTPQIALPSTGGDTGDAQRRAMLSGGAGAAARRKYINR